LQAAGVGLLVVSDPGRRPEHGLPSRRDRTCVEIVTVPTRLAAATVKGQPRPDLRDQVACWPASKWLRPTVIRAL